MALPTKLEVSGVIFYGIKTEINEPEWFGKSVRKYLTSKCKRDVQYYTYNYNYNVVLWLFQLMLENGFQNFYKVCVFVLFLHIILVMYTCKVWALKSSMGFLHSSLKVSMIKNNHRENSSHSYCPEPDQLNKVRHLSAVITRIQNLFTESYKHFLIQTACTHVLLLL